MRWTLYLYFEGVENLFFKSVGNCDFSLPTGLDYNVINSRSMKKVSVSFIKSYFWRKQIIWTIHHIWSLVSIYDLHSSHYLFWMDDLFDCFGEILLQATLTYFLSLVIFFFQFFSILIPKYHALSDDFFYFNFIFGLFLWLEKIFTIKIKIYND